MYTEAQLNKENKTTLTELVLELQQQLVSATSGPLKSSDVEKKLLDLARQATSVQDNAIRREQQHEEAMKQLNNDLELAKAKLEFDFKSSEGKEAFALGDLYKALEEKANVAKDDLSFGLKQAEIDTQAKIDELNDQLEGVKAQYEAEVKGLEEYLESVRETTGAEVTKIKTDHTRIVEQLKYDNSIAIRDENLGVASSIAAKHGSVVVGKSEYESLKAFEGSDSDTIAAQIEVAEKKARSEVYATEGTKYAKLQNESNNTISLLEKDKDYLAKSVGQLNARIEELQDQIKLFPGQLKEAVAASKADITVQQDNKK